MRLAKKIFLAKKKEDFSSTSAIGRLHTANILHYCEAHAQHYSTI
jgi:hypothetical protein